MTKELHGLIDGQPCKLSIDESSGIFSLEIANHDSDLRSALDNSSADRRIHVRLEDGRVATLVGNQFVASRANLGSGFTLKTLRASWVIIGPSEFNMDQEINQIRFTPTNELISIFHTEHKNSTYFDPLDDLTGERLLERGSSFGEIFVQVIDMRRLIAGDVNVDGLNVRLEVQLVHHHDIQGATVVEKRFCTVDYKQPIAAEMALSDAICVCDFMSISVGVIVSPTHMILSVDGAEGDRPMEFELLVRVRKPSPELKPSEANRCLFSSRIDGSAYTEAMSVWLGRRSSWSETYRQATNSLGMKNTISVDRFLTVTRLFESIPSFYMEESERAHRT